MMLGQPSGAEPAHPYSTNNPQLFGSAKNGDWAGLVLFRVQLHPPAGWTIVAV